MQADPAGESPLVIDTSGRGRFARLVDSAISTRASLHQARDRGDTAIHLTDAVGRHGGRFQATFTEPDGARWSMSYDVAGSRQTPSAQNPPVTQAGSGHRIGAEIELEASEFESGETSR